MIGGLNLRYARVESPLAQCTGATAVAQFSILFFSGVHVQSGLRDSDTLICILSFYLLLRLMVPHRVPRAISPRAILRRAYRLSNMLITPVAVYHHSTHKHVLILLRVAVVLENNKCLSISTTGSEVTSFRVHVFAANG